MHVYNSTFIVLSVILLAAAIGGKGAEAANLKLPILDRAWQQIALAVVGIVVGILGLVPPSTSEPIAQTTPTPSPIIDSSPSPESSSLSPSPSPSTSPVQSCGKKLTITAPANKTTVTNGANGLNITITACGLQSGEAGWLFDYDTGDGTYNLDGNGGPVVTTDGQTVVPDKPIGNQGDTNKDTRITLVLANTACGQALTALQSAPQPPTSLPSSCQVVSQIDVYVTYP